jgi:hypothetical protein
MAENGNDSYLPVDNRKSISVAEYFFARIARRGKRRRMGQ